MLGHNIFLKHLSQLTVYISKNDIALTGTGTTVFEWTKTNRQPFNINIGKITR